ncbi:HNH endonuclease [Sporolactobacillus shoreicorticis]|uniref:HNH endonuclease signature motif containing protein n=1 Tax=Sporolactobacillus shoreicorticis TaxID=1923877 RepID=A0ABW5S1T6_9BACL|nr:HNH endonuclease signature motif containing protein [Sporolactobacillus shoreicorticis]MCO7125095.1 HNH endonuclease [Sporolactobacillus shoreicorticis]
MARLLTPEQDQFLSDHVKGLGNAELTAILNENFGLTLTRQQVKTYKKNHGLSSGLTGHYKKGHVPANKGTHNGGWEPTQFKKGHQPANYMPVGTEKMKSDGYMYIKIADPGKWRQKHRLIWEKANGRPIPKGHKLIFGDGDRLNFDLNNLILVTDKQMAILNRKGLIRNNAELTQTGIVLADLFSKMHERKRK